MAIKVPAKVLEELEEIRVSGEINMFDRRGVQYIANAHDFYTTVVWLEENPKDYGRGIFEGFEAEEASS